MIKKISGKPVVLSVHGDKLSSCNVLTHNVDIIEEQTLAFNLIGNNTDDKKWIIEEYKNTKSYYIRAYGDSCKGHVITAMSPDFTWQTVILSPINKERKEQRWVIHRCNRGYYRFNNLKYMNKYLSKVPGVLFEREQNIAVISPPFEIIRIGYVLLDWKITLPESIHGELDNG